MTEAQYQPPQGQPIQFNSDPAATPKRKRWPWILGGVIVIGLVLLGGCVYYGLRFFNSPTGAGTIFAAAVEQGDHELAYNSLCEASKAEIDFDEFVNDHVPSQDVTSVEPMNFALNPNDEIDVFIVGYVLADGSKEVVEYPMVKEDGGWRVCDPPTVP